MLKLRVGDIPEKKPQSANPSPKHPAWYKATDDHSDDYTDLLKQKLGNIECPESVFCDDVNCADMQHRQERDNHVLDLLVART